MKVLRDLSSLSCISHNTNHKFEEISRYFKRSKSKANLVNPPSLDIFTDKRYVSIESENYGGRTLLPFL